MPWFVVTLYHDFNALVYGFVGQFDCDWMSEDPMDYLLDFSYGKRYIGSLQCTILTLGNLDILQINVDLSFEVSPANF